MLTARYTEVLKNLLDNPQTKPLIDQAMSSYPLYVSVSERKYGIPNVIPTREELNKKILNYYKYREIGFETVGRFIDELETALNEIMPYYNQLMFSLDQDYDIKFNVDYKREIDRTREGNRQNENETNRENVSNTNTSGTSTTETEDSNTVTATDSNTTSSTANTYNKHVQSDTPQNQLSITNQNIDNVTYANEADWNHDTTTSSGTSNGSSSSSSTGEGTSETTTNSTGRGTETEGITQNGNETMNETEGTTERTFGNYGATSTQSLIAAYRDLILNIEQRIINDPRISELFMLVY